MLNDGLLLLGGEASGELIIPDGVKRVGCEAFYGCAENLTIHCPKGSSAEEMAIRLGIKVVYDYHRR